MACARDAHDTGAVQRHAPDTGAIIQAKRGVRRRRSARDRVLDLTVAWSLRALRMARAGALRNLWTTLWTAPPPLLISQLHCHSVVELRRMP
jgi:hypothetical protein